MQDHYQITDKEFKKLEKAGIDNEALFYARDAFDPYHKEVPVTKISLMYFIDKHGDFTENQNIMLNKIAMAVFNSLSDDDKIAIMNYLEYVGELEDNLTEEKIDDQDY